jgi:hypothetical protein
MRAQAMGEGDHELPLGPDQLRPAKAVVGQAAMRQALDLGVDGRSRDEDCKAGCEACSLQEV